jgi:hypothetical protein
MHSPPRAAPTRPPAVHGGVRVRVRAPQSRSRFALQALIDFSEPGVDVSVVALFDHEEVSALL